MELDQLKIEFIRELSQINAQIGIHPHFFAVLCALLLESSRLSQDRIHQLTNISSGGISQLIRELSKFFPIDKIKIPKDRTKYYHLDIKIDLFMVTLYEKLGENLIRNINLIEGLIHDIAPYTKSHERFAHLFQVCNDYLTDIRENVAVFNDVRNEFHNLYEVSPENLLMWVDEDELESTYKSFALSTSTSSSSILQKDLHLNMPLSLYQDIYLPLKERMYDIMVGSVGSALTTSRIKALGRITLELMLEDQFLSKEDLIQATRYKPTIINNVLRQLVKRQSVEILDGRKKYYHTKFKLVASPQRKLIASNSFVQSAISVLKKYQERINAESNPDKYFLEFLTQFERAYILYRQYTSKIQLEILKKKV